MKNKMSIEQLERVAREIRGLILDTTYTAGCGHTGGSLSETDILTALFFRVMNIDPENLGMKDRDRFILSKGHATPGYYSALARRGFFPVEVLKTFDELGSILQGHPDMHKVPGVEISSGSLGQGLSCGLGMAMAVNEKNIGSTTFVLMGDGESAEGQIWEAVLYAGAENKKVRNLVAIVDYNKVQLASTTAEAVDLGDLGAKYSGFNWDVIECDGHDMAELVKALEDSKERAKKGPVAVIAHTVKGKGVSFMEGKYQWHGKAPDEQEYRAALKELNIEGAE